MKLRKDKWEQKTIGQTCSVSSGGTPSKVNTEYWTDGTIPWLRSEACKDDVVRGVEEYISDLGFQKSSAKLFKANTTLIALVGATIGKTAFVPFETTTNQNVCGIYPLDESRIFPRFLFYACQSFYAKNFSRYTGFKMANLSFIKALEISLPPLEEQKQIAALFQSIETAIQHVDEQEKNLKALWLKLINEFVSDKPTFGNLLKGKKLIKVNYADVTEKLMRRIEPVSYGVERIVAGENLESEDLKIRTWGVVGKDVLGPAFHVLFKPGDILYGSRRTYLKKVSFADFEGVCANTTYVIKAKENILLQDLLKHIMLSSGFTQYSIGVSKGSTNPYINWKDLDDFTFELPDIKAQSEIANTLDKILKIREQIKQQKTNLKLLKQKLLNEILG